MEIKRCSIEGADPYVLIDTLQSEMADNYSYRSDDLCIITTDKYLLRINSNLLSVVIVDFKDKYRIEIEIISGGGAVSFLRFDWSSEGSANEKIMKIIRKTCEANSWNLFEK